MRALHTTLAALFVLAPALAQEPDPSQWPARDAHEGLTVSCDPYPDAERSKAKFGKKHPAAVGILPIEVAFRNDTDFPMLVDLDSVRLLLQPPGSEKQQLDWMTVEDVLEMILYKQGPSLNRPRTPLPLPRSKGNRSKEYLELESRIRPMALEMTLIPPKKTVRGFLFFRMGRQMEQVENAKLYIPDVKFMHNKQPLFFFEVDLSKAVK